MSFDITYGFEPGIGTYAGLNLDDYEQQGLRIGIFGASGSGKGWLLGLLLEQFRALGLPIIAIDPESELWTLQEVGALVLGGIHGDAPIPQAPDALREVMVFAIDTGTPVVFDLGGITGAAAVLREGERIMGVFHEMTGDLRTRVVFACTEAELFAPQQAPRTGPQPEMLQAIQKRGRKRGVIPVLETQRTADIAKSAISQCNKRFIGHLDEPLDYDAVKRHIAPLTFEAMRALQTGHFIETPQVAEVEVAAREVTHGGATPLAGEVRIRDRATSEELERMLAALRAQANEPQAEEKPHDATWSGQEPKRRPPAEPEAGGVLLTREDAVKYREQEARIARAEEAERLAKQELDRLNLALDLERAGADQLASDVDRVTEEARQNALAAGLLLQLRGVLAGVLGEAVTTATIQMPDGTTFESNGPSREEVIALIREHAPQGGVTTVVMPVEALRTRYLEAAAQRLYERIQGLSADEREALLFMLGHPTYQTVTAVSRGITGSDSGGMKERWSRALVALTEIGLVQIASNGTRKENVDAWVQKELETHNPTPADVEAVKSRALSLLLSPSV